MSSPPPHPPPTPHPQPSRGQSYKKIEMLEQIYKFLRHVSKDDFRKIKSKNLVPHYKVIMN
jgi:hypothetical protein